MNQKSMIMGVVLLYSFFVHQQTFAQVDYELIRLPPRGNADVSIVSASPCGNSVLVESSSGLAIWQTMSNDYLVVDLGIEKSDNSTMRCQLIDVERLIVSTSDGELFVWQAETENVNLRARPLTFDKLQAVRGNQNYIVGKTPAQSTFQRDFHFAARSTGNQVQNVDYTPRLGLSSLSVSRYHIPHDNTSGLSPLGRRFSRTRCVWALSNPE